MCGMAATLALSASVEAQISGDGMQTRREKVGDIPILVVAPAETKGRTLIVWLTGFSGSKESVEPHLRELAKRGFVGLSFDPYQHGERRMEPNEELVKRVRGNIRRYFWPILARTAEETPKVIDWAIQTLKVRKEVGMGGISMGGDIAVAAASVDRRIRAVSACVATPDWMRPGSFEPPGEPDAAAQADYDRRNPLTHLQAYRHRPAIAFQSGADDRQVPPDGGARFVEALKPIYGKQANRLTVNLQPNTPHRFTPEMLENSIAWFEAHLPAANAKPKETALPPLPEGERGIAARYPDDQGIATDPDVLLHEDFEAENWRANWDSIYHNVNLKIVEGRANVFGGKRALEITVPKQEAEISNELVKQFQKGYDILFLRFYSRFEAGFDQIGSSHNGGYLAAIAPGIPYATPGIRADGRNKFAASFENWRGEAETRSPGDLNIYCYHPEQRSEYGDHFFPSGMVLPFSSRPHSFGPHFVSRPNIIPRLGQWRCFEFMLQANTPGQRDGRIACWLDGKCIADFPNLRLRESNALKINFAAIGLHIGHNTIRQNKKWYDDVVIATKYIGPMTRCP